jgi:hypothetical protein
MFKSSAMTVGNMDNILRGWAKLDTAAGETAIQSYVTWGIANYTDATARQYLIDTYHWTINEVSNGIIACVFKTIIKNIPTTCTG